MKTLIFDLDGTMYRGTQPIEGAMIALQECQKHHIPFLFLTNNSMRTAQENTRHMLEMGYVGITPEMFYNSAMAAARYASGLKEGKKAFYIGQAGMKEALENEGFELDEDHPDFVFVGLDKQADYRMYSTALEKLLNGARLIGTNKDRILAKPNGFEVGNGSVVALFEYATGQKSPDIAKPAAPILDYVLEKHNLKREDVILIGDNLESDIALGYNNGVYTVFVESGVHTRQDIERLNIHPDQIVSDLREVDWVRLADAA